MEYLNGIDVGCSLDTLSRSEVQANYEIPSAVPLSG
jgi:hypothetical protein